MEELWLTAQHGLHVTRLKLLNAERAAHLSGMPDTFSLCGPRAICSEENSKMAGRYLCEAVVGAVARAVALHLHFRSSSFGTRSESVGFPTQLVDACPAMTRLDCPNESW